LVHGVIGLTPLEPEVEYLVINEGSTTKIQLSHTKLTELIAIHTSAEPLIKFLISSNLNSLWFADTMSRAPALPQSLKESVEKSKAEYVNLGKSGLRVSIPILGAMSIGHPEWAPWVLDEEKVLIQPRVQNSAEY
jgi:hypothetical protein